VLGPNGTNLLVAGKLAPRGGGLGTLDGRPFIRRERHWPIFPLACKSKHGASDVILIISRQLANSVQRFFEQFRHAANLSHIADAVD
jgi:hypothetical protein